MAEWRYRNLDIKRLEDAARAMLQRYLALVDSGDAGFWDPEKEPEVIALRNALGDGPGSEQWEQECEEFGCHEEGVAAGSDVNGPDGSWCDYCTPRKLYHPTDHPGSEVSS